MTRDEFTARALDEGRLDEAIRHLRAASGGEQDRPLLAQLLAQRGRFDEALAVVHQEVEARAAAGSLSADDLRERGNAAWRADRLADALDDLQEARGREGDPSKARGIETDVAALDQEIRSVQAVERQLRVVNG